MCLENLKPKMLLHTLFTVEPVILGEISASALPQIMPEMNCLVYPVTDRAKESICSGITPANEWCDFTYEVVAWVYAENVFSLPAAVVKGVHSLFNPST